jgi:hypothetical protein
VNPTQRVAWFNLIVVISTLFLVLALVPFLGQASLGGMGTLGLLGFSVFFYRRKPGRVLADERDGLILGRAVVIAYSVFWLAFVLAAALLAPAIFGQDGSVPVVVVQTSVFGGLIVFITVLSVATLIQYSRGTGNAE